MCRRVLLNSAARAAVLAIALAGIVLAGCAGGGPPTDATPGAVLEAQGGNATPTGLSAPNLARSDAQGAVEVVVSPRAWNRQAGGILEFEVSMDTHSVDLSMDLAALSTLQSDAGIGTAASAWTGGTGHHVMGVLSFPLVTPEGRSLIHDATVLILTIRDVDAPQRIFRWEIAELP